MRRPLRWGAALMAMAVAGAQAVGVPVSVVDDTGQRVALPAAAQRVVSLSPHLTEMVFAVGAGDHLVAVSAHSDYPPAATALPRVAAAGTLHAERILALEPDLVLAWGSGQGHGRIGQLRRLGVPVFTSEPRRLEDVADTLERLGRLLGREPAARSAAAEYRRRLAGLSAHNAGRRPVSVFYQVWHDPLTTINGEHVIDRVIRLCGGRNVFADLPTLAPVISLEQLLERDPRAILVARDETAGATSAWSRWRELRAVRHGHVLAVPADLLHRHGPRLLDGAEAVCEALDAVRR